MAGKLTAKQRLFAKEYLIDLNATAAARRAGYSEKTARFIAVENLTKPNIRAAIEKAMSGREKRIETTSDMVLKELAKIGFANVADYMKVDDYEIVTGYEVDKDGKMDISKPIKKIIRGVEIFKTNEIDKDKLQAIAGIKQTANGIELKLHDKVKALELLGKHLNMFKDASPPVINNINIPGLAQLSTEDLRAIAYGKAE